MVRSTLSFRAWLLYTGNSDHAIIRLISHHCRDANINVLSLSQSAVTSNIGCWPRARLPFNDSLLYLRSLLQILSFCCNRFRVCGCQSVGYRLAVLEAFHEHERRNLWEQLEGWLPFTVSSSCWRCCTSSVCVP